MKPPRFLKDLYSDLRDRRLLPVVVVLLVAIPALPVALGSKADAPPAPSPATNGALTEEEIPTLPAVLAADPGLRDYRKRLDAVDSKDPFAEQFANSSPKGAQAASVSKVEGLGGSAGASGTASATPSDTVSSTATGTGAAATSPSSDATVSSTGTAPASSGGGSGSGGGGKGGSVPSSGVQFYTFRIDVVTGRAGDTERRGNVKRLTVLPSQSNPVAVFMGVAEEGKRASFLVSTDVVRSHGDGRCTPSPADCQLLSLRVGEERKFEYAPRGEPDTYVIHLKDILVVPIDDPRSGSGKEGRDSNSAEAGLKSFLGL